MSDSVNELLLLRNMHGCDVPLPRTATPSHRNQHCGPNPPPRPTQHHLGSLLCVARFSLQLATPCTQAPAFRKAQRGKADAFFTQAKQVSRASDAEGLTPLMLAAKVSALAAMRVLLEARADPTVLRALPAAGAGGAAGGSKGGKKAKSSGGWVVHCSCVRLCDQL